MAFLKANERTGALLLATFLLTSSAHASKSCHRKVAERYAVGSYHWVFTGFAPEIPVVGTMAPPLIGPAAEALHEVLSRQESRAVEIEVKQCTNIAFAPRVCVEYETTLVAPNGYRVRIRSRGEFEQHYDRDRSIGWFLADGTTEIQTRAPGRAWSEFVEDSDRIGFLRPAGYEDGTALALGMQVVDLRLFPRTPLRRTSPPIYRARGLSWNQLIAVRDEANTDRCEVWLLPVPRR